jgi:hypothetical protein
MHERAWLNAVACVLLAKTTTPNKVQNELGFYTWSSVPLQSMQ